MNEELVNAKIGDEVYSPDVSYRPIRYGKIVGQTAKSWVILVDGTTYQANARKADGYEMGSGAGGGRFAHFDRKHWYILTEERKRLKILKERTMKVRDELKALDDRSKFLITSGNIEEVEFLVKTLALTMKKEDENA